MGSETIPPDPKPITIEELNASVEKPAHDEMSAKENMTFPVKHINLTALASSGMLIYTFELKCINSHNP